MFNPLFLATDIAGVADNAQKWLHGSMARPLIIMFGVILLIYAAYATFRAITAGQGRAGSYWFKAGLGFVIGGVLTFAASTIDNVGNSTKQTVNQFASGDVEDKGISDETITLPGVDFPD